MQVAGIPAPLQQNSSAESVVQLNHELVIIKEQLQATLDENDQLKGRIATRESESAQIMAESVGLNEQVQALSKALEDGKDALTEETHGLRAQIDQLKSEVDNKSRQIVELNGDVAEKSSQLAEMQDKVQNMSTEIDGLRLINESDTLANEMQNLKSQYDSLESEITVKNGQISALNVDLEKKADEVCELEEQVTKLSQEVEGLKATRVSGQSQAPPKQTEAETDPSPNSPKVFSWDAFGSASTGQSDDPFSAAISSAPAESSFGNDPPLTGDNSSEEIARLTNQLEEVSQNYARSTQQLSSVQTELGQVRSNLEAVLTVKSALEDKLQSMENTAVKPEDHQTRKDFLSVPEVSQGGPDGGQTEQGRSASSYFGDDASTPTNVSALSGDVFGVNRDVAATDTGPEEIAGVTDVAWYQQQLATYQQVLEL